MPGILTMPVLRNLIDELILGDSELEAFVVDHFPQIKRLYGNGMDRTTKVNILFERASCDQIYGNLCQRYPQVVTPGIPAAPHDGSNSGSTPKSCPGVEPVSGNQVRYFLVLTGTINELDEPKIRALVAHIRKVSGDAELTLEAIKSGSIILHLRGSAEGMECLRQAFRSGELQELLGHQLKDIGPSGKALPGQLIASGAEYRGGIPNATLLPPPETTWKLNRHQRMAVSASFVALAGITLVLCDFFAHRTSRPEVSAQSGKTPDMKPDSFQKEPVPVEATLRQTAAKALGVTMSVPEQTLLSIESRELPSNDFAAKHKSNQPAIGVRGNFKAVAQPAIPIIAAKQRAKTWEVVALNDPRSKPKPSTRAAIAPHVPLPPSLNATTNGGAETILREAQAHFDRGDRQRAIALALLVTRNGGEEAIKAWRLVGSAACIGKFAPQATSAYRNLRDPDHKRLLVELCRRNGLHFADGAFSLREE